MTSRVRVIHVFRYGWPGGGRRRSKITKLLCCAAKSKNSFSVGTVWFSTWARSSGSKDDAVPNGSLWKSKKQKQNVIVDVVTHNYIPGLILYKLLPQPTPLNPPLNQSCTGCCRVSLSIFSTLSIQVNAWYHLADTIFLFISIILLICIDVLLRGLKEFSQ